MKKYLFIFVFLFGLGINSEVGWGDGESRHHAGPETNNETNNNNDDGEVKWEVKRVDWFKDVLALRKTDNLQDMQKIFENTKNSDDVAKHALVASLSTLTDPKADEEQKRQAQNMLNATIEATMTDEDKSDRPGGSKALKYAVEAARNNPRIQTLAQHLTLLQSIKNFQENYQKKKGKN